MTTRSIFTRCAGSIALLRVGAISAALLAGAALSLPAAAETAPSARQGPFTEKNYLAGERWEVRGLRSLVIDKNIMKAINRCSMMGAYWVIDGPSVSHGEAVIYWIGRYGVHRGYVVTTYSCMQTLPVQTK